MTLDRPHPAQTITAPKRRVVGVGNVGREPGMATYTLYSPYSDRLEFKTVYYGSKKRTARSDLKSEQGRSKQGFGN